MIRVAREPEPAILAQKKADWLQKFLARKKEKPAERPPSAQYAHKTIVGTLRAMSHAKCFYCETKGTLEVDHYIEVAEDPTLAFEWHNLYLSCKPCNSKATNQAIPAADCVDPCDSSCDPGEHLEFVGEELRYRTERGNATIRKYRLADGVGERRRVLQTIANMILALTKTKGRDALGVDERARLWRTFAHDDAEFALMARAYLRALDLSPME